MTKQNNQKLKPYEIEVECIVEIEGEKDLMFNNHDPRIMDGFIPLQLRGQKCIAKVIDILKAQVFDVIDNTEKEMNTDIVDEVKDNYAKEFTKNKLEELGIIMDSYNTGNILSSIKDLGGVKHKLFVDDNGNACIPDFALRSALKQASWHTINPGHHISPSIMKKITILDTSFPIISPEGKKVTFEDFDQAKNGCLIECISVMSDSRTHPMHILSYRPVIKKGWKATFRVKINSAIIDSFTRMLDVCGRDGILDYRPSYGTFKVLSVNMNIIGNEV